MPFDENHGPGPDGWGDRNPLRELALATMDAFDRKIDEMNLCDGCATRALVQEALLSLLMIGYVHGLSAEKIGTLVNHHFQQAHAILEHMKKEGIL
jgi:hypothetical protein